MFGVFVSGAMVLVHAGATVHNQARGDSLHLIGDRPRQRRSLGRRERAATRTEDGRLEHDRPVGQLVARRRAGAREVLRQQRVDRLRCPPRRPSA